MIFNMLCFMVMDKALPFSQAFEDLQQANAGVQFILIILLGILAGIHFVLTRFNHAIYVYLALAFIINLILWKVAYRITPEKLNQQQI
jgi:ABC-2 type transport system permease protein